jgi:hypothetical protein
MNDVAAGTAKAMATDVRLPHIVVIAFGALAGTILASQIVLSRLLAATLGYYFGFMIVSLVMVGLGAGALFVKLAPRLFTAQRVLDHAAIGSLIAGVASFAGTQAMLDLYPRLGTSTGFHTYDFGAAELGAIFWCFFPMYFSGGTVVSLMLMHARGNFYRLYAVDLLGAACGAVLSMVLLEAMSPSAASLGPLSVLPILAAAGFAFGGGSTKLGAGTLLVGACVAFGGQLLLQDPHVRDPSHRTRVGTEPRVTAWNSFSNVSVYRGRFFTWALSNTYQGAPHDMMSLMIDGIGGTQIVRFDGKPESLERYEYLAYDLTQLAHELVPASGKQLIIGPGACVDVLQAYRAGRRDITAVEINPLVYEIVNHRVKDFSGGPCDLPGVKMELENGRTFIKRTEDAWDLISLTWVDSGGSRTATALNEDYLYTVDAYAEFIGRLKPSGYLGFMRSLGVGLDMPLDSSRAIAITMAALRELGVEDPKRNVLVALADSTFFRRPMVFVMAKRSAITADEIDRARAYLERMQFLPIWLPDGSLGRDTLEAKYQPIGQIIFDIITTTDPEALYRQASIDVEPPTDDRPFYFIQRAGANREANEAMAQLFDAMLILATLVIPFLVLPLLPLMRQQRLGGSVTWTSMAYYSLLGVAFMMVEIELFHILGLALGRPTLSLAVVLGSLLVFSGVGSLCAPALVRRGSRGVLLAFAVLLGLLGLFALTKAGLLAFIVAQPLTARVLLCIAVIAPLAVVMGTPMSMAMTVLEERPDLMVWGWSLNGAFSVFGSVLSMYLATTIGIAAAIAIGTACYAVACTLLLWMRKEQAT